MDKVETLPEFDAPPLNEVVMGVQFQSPPNYQQIRAFEVWQLYRDNFPVVEEYAPLPPQFETFGLPPTVPSFSFNMLTGGTHDRFWFVDDDGGQLIQFQQDRMLHNWRKVEPGRNDYPRFENIIAQFEGELHALESYFDQLDSPRLIITQCELSYINHIPVEDGSKPFLPQTWFTFAGNAQAPVDDYTNQSKSVLKDEVGKPYGRFYRESDTRVDSNGQKILRFNLTARGRPVNDDVSSALSFLAKHRQIIANEFLASTTDFAQKMWKRTQ